MLFAAIGRRCLVCAITLLGLCIDCHAAEKSCARPMIADDRAEVQISGTLKNRTEWGPPSFGEYPKTDQKFVAWIVKTDIPIPVILGRGSSMRPRAVAVNEIQITGRMVTEGELNEYLGRHVRVTGKIWTQAAPLDVTPIVIQASFIRLGNNSRCDGEEISPRI